MAGGTVLGTLWRRATPWLPWAGVLVLLAFLVQAVHPAALAAALRSANLWWLFPLVGTTLLGLLLRGIRWHLLLRPLDAPNSLWDSLRLYTAAQAALLVPGGQFLLPVLQRSQYGTLIRRSAPTILVQELVYGLLEVPAALPGVPPYHPAAWMLLAALIFNAGTGAALLSGGITRLVQRLAEHVPFLRGPARNLAEMQLHFGVIARSGEAFWGSLLDMGAIACAGLGFYAALLAVGAFQLTWIDGLAVYSLGSAVGTISALPGGLGATEDVSTLVLTRLGLAAGPAAAATLLFRAASLLIGTALGWTVLLLARQRMNIHPSPAGLAKAARGAEAETLEGERPATPPESYLK